MVVVALIARYVLAVMFVRAGALKVADRSEFRVVVSNYKLVPPALVGPIAATLPVAEVLCGALLLIGLGTGPISAGLAVLLVVFSAAVAVNLRQGRRISCGCSGRLAPEITWRHVATDGALAALALIVSVWSRQPLTLMAVWGLPAKAFVGDGQALAVLLVVATVASASLLVNEVVHLRAVLARSKARVEGGLAG